MSFRTTFSPLGGEHVLAVAPAPAFPSVDAGWRRRTRMFTGRALDDRALIREQDARAGQLTLLGQTLSPGRIAGLEVRSEVTPSGDFVRVAPGIGLLPSGEDVVLGRELRISLAALAPGGAPARAGILTLEPVIRRIQGGFDPDDPCLRDENDDAFADEQWVDGVRATLLPWDDAWTALDDGNARRNPLAYVIFELERALGPDEVAPWQLRGLPLALIGFADGRIAFVDRHAVVRQGGHAPPRAPLVPRPLRAGSHALWQARLLQLVEQIADARATSGPSPTAASMKLELLPPAGVLSREAVALDPLTNRFFPPAWRLRCAPVPREQLDGVLQRAVGLAPLSTLLGEEVLVLVPVPQAVYEPGLLVFDEQPDPLFRVEIDRLVAERSELLSRRLYSRARRDSILGAIDRSRVVPDLSPDPGALEDEGAVAPRGDGERDYELVDVAGTLRPRAVVELKARLDRPMPGPNAPLLSERERAMLFDAGLAPLIAEIDAKLKRAEDTIDFGFLKAQTDIYRLRQYMLGDTLATRLAVSPALAMIAKGETSVAVREDLARLTGILGKAPATTASHSPAPSAAPTPALAPFTAGPAIAPETRVPRAVITRPPTAAERAIGLAEPARFELELGSAGIGVVSVRRGAERERPELGRTTDVDAVRGSGAVIGGETLRTVSVAERLAPVVSTEIRNAAKATNYASAQSLLALHDLGLNVSDLDVYGAVVPDATVRTPIKLGVLVKDRAQLDRLLGDPKLTGNVDESVFFHDATTVLEGHIVTLRNLEGRVAQYREVLADCKQVLVVLTGLDYEVGFRIAELDHELTERRQAIATARALLADEVARLARLTARRRAVIAQHVELLAYVRPRFFDGLLAVPKLPLDPTLVDSPLPACLGNHPDAPDEIDRLLLLLREAPLAWLPRGATALDHLDRIELLHGLVLTARGRVQGMQQAGFAALRSIPQATGRFGASLAAVARAQVDAIWQPRAEVAQLDVRRFVGLSWIESRDAARHVVSLGDLIEGSHGRSAAAQAALAELDRIGKVAACLWARVGDVSPAIRLAWAEALSQYEPGHSLRTLSMLPRWREIDFRLRHDIEALAEWLVDRADPARPEAVAWMLDLVRTAILLASHAPVDEIIAAHVPSPAPAHPGALVPVAIDPGRTRIGMHVTFFHGGAAVARGVVEDLVGDRARARISEAIRADLRLDAGVRVQLTVRPPAPGIGG